MESLVAHGEAKWIAKNSAVLVYWHSIAAWASLLERMSNERHLSGVVCTTYELRESDEARIVFFVEINRYFWKC